MTRDPFAFARVNARTVAAATEARAALIERLGVAEADVPALQASPVWPLFVTYCIEGPLNIVWYDEKIAAWRTRQRGFLAACVGVTAALLALLVSRAWSESVIAQLGATLAALLACLRILAGATDVRTQLGGFWRARADLKEAYLTFEQAWRGHVVDGGRVAEGLEAALWQEITQARHVVRRERDTYFSTFAAPGDVVAATTGSLDAVLGRADKRPPPLAPSAARLQAMDEARRRLDAAQAERAAQAALSTLLATRPAAMTEETWARTRQDAEAARARAEADVARYQALLLSAAKAATIDRD